MEILHEMLARTTPETIYAALTEQSGLASWFTTDVHAEAKIGSLVEFKFDKGERMLRIQIIDLVPCRKVQWKLLQGLPGWEHMNALITWSLTPVEWGTIVHFSHNGWETTDGAFPSVSFKWATFMSSLKKYGETGTGMPAS